MNNVTTYSYPPDGLSGILRYDSRTSTCAKGDSPPIVLFLYSCKDFFYPEHSAGALCPQLLGCFSSRGKFTPQLGRIFSPNWSVSFSVHNDNTSSTEGSGSPLCYFVNVFYFLNIPALSTFSGKCQPFQEKKA